MPPILGGKSLVTRRWVIVAGSSGGGGSGSSAPTIGVVGAGEAGQQILASEAAGRPHGVRPQQRVRVAQVAHAAPPSTAGSRGSPTLPEDDEGVAAHVARLAARDVPALGPREDDRVVVVEQVEQRHPRALVARRPLATGARRLGGHTSWHSSQP